MGLGNVRQVDDNVVFRRVVAQVLDGGGPALVYPEGGRHPDGLGPFRPWAAQAALDHQVPLVPASLSGTAPGQTGPVVLVVGGAIPPEGDAAGLTDALRSAIVSLAQEAAR
jgi:1-acyl-sn-glycerol-3-phosphate acyltransferase